MSHEVSYGYTRELPGVSVEQAIERTTSALKSEGFGVLTTIDVQDTLKKKIGADFRKYVILGACNPNLANRALGAELGVGLLLPCNVCVFQGDTATTVQVLKPQAMVQVAANPALEPVVKEADERLRRVLEHL